MQNARTDLAMERTGNMPDSARGIEVSSRCQGAVETTLVRIINQEAAKRLSKAQGEYWTLQHPCLPELDPEERMRMAELTAGEIRRCSRGRARCWWSGWETGI